MTASPHSDPVERLISEAGERIDFDIDDFADAVIGRGLPAQAEALIAQAGQLRQAPGQAESLLLQARALAPSHPAPLIALYRFHFYGHRLQEARAVAVDALRIGRAALGAEFDAEALTPAQTRFDAAVRFYLFALKGYAYLCLRLGDLGQGSEALDELRRLDPEDRVGGAVLAAVLARAQLSDEDDDDLQRAPLPARGWASDAGPGGSSS